jgi:hypothetical protein
MEYDGQLDSDPFQRAHQHALRNSEKKISIAETGRQVTLRTDIRFVQEPISNLGMMGNKSLRMHLTCSG